MGVAARRCVGGKHSEPSYGGLLRRRFSRNATGSIPSIMNTGAPFTPPVNNGKEAESKSRRYQARGTRGRHGGGVRPDPLGGEGGGGGGPATLATQQPAAALQVSPPVLLWRAGRTHAARPGLPARGAAAATHGQGVERVRGASPRGVAGRSSSHAAAGEGGGGLGGGRGGAAGRGQVCLEELFTSTRIIHRAQEFLVF